MLTDVELQRVCEEHLAACHDAMYDDDGQETIDKDTPAYGPFDGCPTCVVREVLLKAYDELLERVKNTPDNVDQRTSST